MTREIAAKGKEMYTCEICGFGYSDRTTAQACQSWCGKHKSCNLQITKNAVYFPK